MNSKFYTNLITLKKNQKIRGVYDVEMGTLNTKGYHTLECHIVFYPYSRNIQGEHITFSPFEEYVKDILSCQRSAYSEIISEFNKVFGLCLGLFIVVIFYTVKPEDLISVGSVVSVIGAYIIGKELWDDIERIAVTLSKKWRIRYTEPYYQYKLEKHTTLTRYSYLAKERRYKKIPLLPEKIDFIQQSNSQTVRMYFNLSELPSIERSAHLLSITIDPHFVTDLEEDGFLFGVKLSFNKKFCGVSQCFELFQSIDKDSKGCLTEEGEWVHNSVFSRNTVIFGKVKWFKKAGIIPDVTIIRY